jgi:hypothetical protein
MWHGDSARASVGTERYLRPGAATGPRSKPGQLRRCCERERLRIWHLAFRVRPSLDGERRLTFELSGRRRYPGGCPLERRVRRHSLSETWLRSATGVPEREHNDFAGCHAVVDVVPDSGQKKTPQYGISGRGRLRSNPGLLCKKVLGFLEVVGDCVWRRWPVFQPPTSGPLELRGCARSDLYFEHLSQEIRRRRRSASSAEIVSPLSA